MFCSPVVNHFIGDVIHGEVSGSPDKPGQAYNYQDSVFEFANSFKYGAQCVHSAAKPPVKSVLIDSVLIFTSAAFTSTGCFGFHLKYPTNPNAPPDNISGNQLFTTSKNSLI